MYFAPLAPWVMNNDFFGGKCSVCIFYYLFYLIFHEKSHICVVPQHFQRTVFDHIMTCSTVFAYTFFSNRQFFHTFQSLHSSFFKEVCAETEKVLCKDGVRKDGPSRFFIFYLNHI